tara:strand:+ start:115 stop:879 length:765 start_codon:yes stop_codon:yes gene_type:complete
LSPGASLVFEVSLQLVLESTVEEFDEDTFRSTLAASLNVQPEQIDLVVSASSILVKAVVRSITQLAANEVLTSTTTLLNTTADVLSAQLQIPVVEFTQPQLDTITVIAPSPPPPVPPPPSPPPSPLPAAPAPPQSPDVCRFCSLPFPSLVSSEFRCCDDVFRTFGPRYTCAELQSTFDVSCLGCECPFDAPPPPPQPLPSASPPLSPPMTTRSSLVFIVLTAVLSTTVMLLVVAIVAFHVRERRMAHMQQLMKK